MTQWLGRPPALALLALGMLMAFAPTSAKAQGELDFAGGEPVADGGGGGGSGLAQLGPWNERSITLPKMTLRIDVGPPEKGILDSGFLGDAWAFGRGYGLTLSDAGDDVASGLGVGAAFGILDELEVGMLLFPIQFTPGDDHFGDITLYGRYKFFSTDVVDIGGQLLLQLPSRTDFGMGMGLPIMLRLGDSVRIDTGVEFELIFVDVGPDDDEVAFGMDIPAGIAFQIGKGFVGPRTGLFLYKYIGDAEFALPLGVFGGVTVAEMVDITAEFAFTQFLTSAGDDAFGEDSWRFNVGANIHLSL